MVFYFNFMQMDNNIVVGIDIGGSHITAALIDLQAHAIIPRSLIRRHINSKGTAEQIINEWSNVIAGCKACHSRTSAKLGIAMPGPFDYKNGISFIQGLDKYEALYNHNVKALLAASLRIEEADILMMNDAGCFLKGEVFGGAARDCNNVIGITLGTGLGSAVFKDGVLHDGDLFYTPYKDGTAEDYISTRWFVNEYEKRTGRTAGNVKELGERTPADKVTAFLFTEFGKNLGEVLAAYIKKHNAENVVIGGNIINAWELFMPETQTVLESHDINVSPVKAMLGEEAALLGAGSLCF